MNQYLLNDEVHVYDFANGKPMVCDLFNGVPCCIPREDFMVPPGTFRDDRSETVNKWEEVWRTQRREPKKINCPETFGLDYEGKNACKMINYDGSDGKFTCNGKFFTALMNPLIK